MGNGISNLRVPWETGKTQKAKEGMMDREKIAKEILKIQDAIKSMEQEDEMIKQLETTDPDKARKMMTDQCNKLIEHYKKHKVLLEKYKKAKND
jgi:hypothetical protein